MSPSATHPSAEPGPSFRRGRPFHSNTPGSAIDLTEMINATPPLRTLQLRSDTPSPPRSRPDSIVDLNEDLADGIANGHGPGNGIGSGSGNGHDDHRAHGSFREEMYEHDRERVDVEMGGVGDLSVLLRTIDFAAQKHSCQRRKDVDQTPYINHPIAVANFLSATGITDVRVLQAAVLHDTVEDTHTTIEEIESIFGADVARIVHECTDNPTLSGQQRKAEQVRTAPHKSKEAQQVKLADKMHNLESIRRSPPVGWGVRRIQAYFIWAKQVTDACAASHPILAARLQHLYETAYTRVDGKYHPCHPEVCGPLTEEEKTHIDSRLSCLKVGETPSPKPIFF